MTLVLIDKKREVYIDDSFILAIGARGLNNSTFFTRRIQEGITKGIIFDASFKLGKESLLLYPSGQSIVTHISVNEIRKLSREVSYTEVQILEARVVLLTAKLKSLCDEKMSAPGM